MRTGITLEVLRREVMIEARLSTGAAHAVQYNERVKHLINKTERDMATEDDWPAILIEEETTVAAEAQYTPLPPNISFSDINQVWTAYGVEWIELTHGIGLEERSIYNTSQRADPFQRWEIYPQATDQIEVWPISSTAQTLRWSGSRALGGMDKESKTCTLDGDVIVSRAAAEILIGDKNVELATTLLARAQRRTNTLLKKQGAQKGPSINLAHGPQRRLRPGLDYIAPGS